MTSNFSQLSTDALSPGQLPESVKALLKRAHINRYPKRTTIVDAGTESKSLYLILKGSVSIILREDLCTRQISQNPYPIRVLPS
ncbi:cyclic nucleotide-binding domain protein [Acinetobacter baumannii 42057_5]|nr:cyclic nucleotide-binding domain protein [Acinetobacter baumannii 42057_5]